MKPYKRKGVPLDGIVKTLVSSWTIDPASVRQTVAQANENGLPGSESLALKAAYRALGIAGKNSYEIYAQIFAQVKRRYRLDLGTVYSDTTSAFFNGGACAPAKKGRSKDHRPDKPQVSISLAVTGSAPVVPVTPLPKATRMTHGTSPTMLSCSAPACRKARCSCSTRGPTRRRTGKQYAEAEITSRPPARCTNR